MREEDRVRLLALPAPGCGVSPHQAVRAPGRPMMVRRGPPLTIGAAASRQSEVVQAPCAVAQRALRDTGEQPFKLVLSDDPVSAQHAEHAPVDLGQPGNAGIKASPTARAPGGRARRAHGRGTGEDCSGGEHSASANAKRVTGNGEVEESGAPPPPGFRTGKPDPRPWGLPTGNDRTANPERPGTAAGQGASEVARLAPLKHPGLSPRLRICGLSV